MFSFVVNYSADILKAMNTLVGCCEFSTLPLAHKRNMVGEGGPGALHNYETARHDKWTFFAKIL